MSERKYKVGQLVRVVTGAPMMPKEPFKIVALMPSTEKSEPQYRIKSSLDSRERMVREAEISS